MSNQVYQTTVEELEAYLEGYRRELDARDRGGIGISSSLQACSSSTAGMP